MPNINEMVIVQIHIVENIGRCLSTGSIGMRLKSISATIRATGERVLLSYRSIEEAAVCNRGLKDFEYV